MDWPFTPLGAHATIRARIGWRGLTAAEYTSDGPYLVAGQHITAGQIDWTRCDHLSERRYRESWEIALEEGDIVLSKDGTIGRTARVDHLPGPATINGTMMLVRCGPRLDYRFLYHYLQGRRFRRLIEDRVSGSSIPHLFQRDMVELLVPLPRIREQTRIAEVLDSVDEAVGAAERLVAKQAQVKSGLSAALLADDEGWEDVRVAQLLRERPRNGYSPQEVERTTGAVMLGLGCLTAEGFKPRQLKNAPEGDPALTRAELSDGDLLVSRANTRDLVGLAGTFRDVGKRCIYPDLMMRLEANDSVSTSFLELILRSQPVRRQIQAQAVGTSESMVKVSAPIVLGLRARIPTRAEQDWVIRRLESVDASRGAANAELEKLRKLRQGLMDDLLTGRVRVSS